MVVEVVSGLRIETVMVWMVLVSAIWREIDVMFYGNTFGEMSVV